MTSKMADDPKCYQALLNGLAKRNYYGSPEFTDEVLKDEIYPELNQEDFNRLISKCSGLLKNLVSADMDMTQLEAFLTAQMKRKEGGLTKEQAAVMSKFWKGNKAKIHDSIVSQTMWGNSLQKVTWRVDLKSQSKDVEELHAPTAIMELHVADNLEKDKKPEVVRFELDEEKVAEMLANMRSIDNQINRFTKK